MNKIELAKSLTTTLSNVAWTPDRLKSGLIRRLPKELHVHASDISSDLIGNFPTIYSPPPDAIAESLLSISGFDRIFAYCHRHSIWPNPDLSFPRMHPIPAFSKLELPDIPTLADLTDWLVLPPDKLDYITDLDGRYEEHGDVAVNHYHYALLPKKSKDVRLIEAPKPTLKSLQHKILRGILNLIPTHKNAFGFVQGRNCLDAANRHVSEETVICFDLQNFFASIQYKRIYGLFRCLGYPHTVAQHLTGLCTTRTPERVLSRLNASDRALYRQPHLPQGAPTSPSLANHVSFTLDRRLSGLARSIGANYSRYADDLSFSGDRHITGTLLQMLPEIVRAEGFSLNSYKTHIMAASSRQVVTGIVVNQHLNIDRRTYDRIKAIIHACSKQDDIRLYDPFFKTSLDGQIAWMEAVNPHRGQKLRTRFQMVLDGMSG